MNESSSAKPVIGIDIGATNMLLCVASRSGEIIARHHSLTEAGQGFNHVLENLIRSVHQVCEQSGRRIEDIESVGVAVAGAVDHASGVVLMAQNLQWSDIPLLSILQDKLGKPVVIENDVNAAIWGEYRTGAGLGQGDCFGVWVGTGIGGGLILNQRLYHGALSTAGEFGMTIITPEGKTGSRTVEDHAGRTGMRRHLARLLVDHTDSVLHELSGGDAERIGTNELARAYEQNDPLACKVIDRGAALLGTAIANFVTMLSVDTVIVGGGITEALGDTYLQHVRDQFDRDVFPERCRSCRIIKTQLESDAGMLGAALLALEAVD